MKMSYKGNVSTLITTKSDYIAVMWVSVLICTLAFAVVI